MGVVPVCLGGHRGLPPPQARQASGTRLVTVGGLAGGGGRRGGGTQGGRTPVMQHKPGDVCTGGHGAFHSACKALSPPNPLPPPYKTPQARTGVRSFRFHFDCKVPSPTSGQRALPSPDPQQWHAKNGLAHFAEHPRQTVTDATQMWDICAHQRETLAFFGWGFLRFVEGDGVTRSMCTFFGQPLLTAISPPHPAAPTAHEERFQRHVERI